MGRWGSKHGAHGGYVPNEWTSLNSDFILNAIVGLTDVSLQIGDVQGATKQEKDARVHKKRTGARREEWP